MPEARALWNELSMNEKAGPERESAGGFGTH